MNDGTPSQEATVEGTDTSKSSNNSEDKEADDEGNTPRTVVTEIEKTHITVITYH